MEVVMQMKTSGIRPEKVKAARTASGLTQAEAARLVYTSIDNWQNWEQGRNIIARAIYELFLLKTGQITLATARAGLWTTS
jgi:DNA-binding transcriptional regulator YiaG